MTPRTPVALARRPSRSVRVVLLLVGAVLIVLCQAPPARAQVAPAPAVSNQEYFAPIVRPVDEFGVPVPLRHGDPTLGYATACGLHNLGSCGSAVSNFPTAPTWGRCWRPGRSMRSCPGSTTFRSAQPRWRAPSCSRRTCGPALPTAATVDHDAIHLVELTAESEGSPSLTP